jgi:hypothetical protein
MNENLTDIVVVMDRSGSMGSVRNDSIGGFNTMLEDQKNGEGEAHLSLIQFSTDYETVYDNVPIDDVKPLTPETYRPRGWTALLDAIINTIDEVGVRLDKTPEDERPGKVIVVIITDGFENRSEEYPSPGGYNVCRERIQHQTDVYGWEFIFLAANQDAVLTGGTLGVKSKLSKTYTPSKDGTQSAYRGMSLAVSALRKGDNDDAVNEVLESVVK